MAAVLVCRFVAGTVLSLNRKLSPETSCNVLQDMLFLSLRLTIYHSRKPRAEAQRRKGHEEKRLNLFMFTLRPDLVLGVKKLNKFIMSPEISCNVLQDMFLFALRLTPK